MLPTAGYDRSIAEAIGTSDREAVAGTEAYMRLERGTLDSLDRVSFRRLARDCYKAVKADPEAARSLAATY